MCVKVTGGQGVRFQRGVCVYICVCMGRWSICECVRGSMRFVSVCVQRGVRVCSRYSCARGENIFGKIVYFSLLILASGKIDKLGTNKMFFECHNLALCRTLDTPG